MSNLTIVNIDGAPLARGNLEVGNLPLDYVDQSIAAIRDCARVVMFEMGVTRNNRDLDHVGEYLASVVAAGEDLAVKLPWFEDYYRGELRQSVSEAIEEEAVCLNSLNEILLGLAFGPGMRIEAHTDVWAINANLFLKAAVRKEAVPTELAGGTIIGHKDAKSHTEILASPIAILAGKVGTIGVIAASKYPHTIGVAETPAIFERPDISSDEFWANPATRISFNISYATERQLSEEPTLRPMTSSVGYSKPVLGM
ncbi:MAG: hypothetical protein JWM81_238 [Candidatus Saccharibacteria bacterium]|nr:hypothetical protein [Candidatus Saccharibacteria bacterium]